MLKLVTEILTVKYLSVSESLFPFLFHLQLELFSFLVCFPSDFPVVKFMSGCSVYLVCFIGMLHGSLSEAYSLVFIH